MSALESLRAALVTSHAARRKAEHRKRMADDGLITVSVVVPRAVAASFTVAADRVRADRTLDINALFSRATGRFVSLNRQRHPASPAHPAPGGLITEDTEQ